MADFNLGSIVCTKGVFDLISRDPMFAKFIRASLSRHSIGDWGDLCKEDERANELALIEGSRILSAYNLVGQPKVWIITEADRSVTTILFPSEY